MSVSSIDSSSIGLLSQYYYQNRTSDSNTNSSKSTSTADGLKGVTSINSDGDTFQMSGVTASTMLSTSEMYSKMDTDSDGSVSESEFAASRPSDVTEEMAQNLYSSFDTDSSGSLTESEYEMAMNNAVSLTSASTSSTSDTLAISEMFSSMDTNGDDTVSADEFAALRPSDVTAEMAANLYSSFDTDSSGSLTESEFETAMTNALSMNTISATSSTSSAAATQSTSASGGGTSSASNSCPLGNSTCTSCGQCGKITLSSSSSSSSSTQNNTNAQTNMTIDYLSATAVKAYETNSVYL